MPSKREQARIDRILNAKRTLPSTRLEDLGAAAADLHRLGSSIESIFGEMASDDSYPFAPSTSSGFEPKPAHPLSGMFNWDNPNKSFEELNEAFGGFQSFLDRNIPIGGSGQHANPYLGAGGPETARFAPGGDFQAYSVENLHARLSSVQGNFQVGGLQSYQYQTGEEEYGFFATQTWTNPEGEVTDSRKYWMTVDPQYGGVRVAPEGNMSGFWAVTGDYRQNEAGRNRANSFDVMAAAFGQSTPLTRYLSDAEERESGFGLGQGVAAWKPRDSMSLQDRAKWGWGAVTVGDIGGDGLAGAIQDIQNDFGETKFAYGGGTHLFPQEQAMRSMLPSRQRGGVEEFMVSSIKRPQGFFGEHSLTFNSIGLPMEQEQASFRLEDEQGYTVGTRVRERRDLLPLFHAEGQIKSRQMMRGNRLTDRTYNIDQEFLEAGGIKSGDVFMDRDSLGTVPAIQEGYQHAGSLGDLEKILGRKLPSGSIFTINDVKAKYNEHGEYVGAMPDMYSMDLQAAPKEGAKDTMAFVRPGEMEEGVDLWGVLPSDKDLPTYAYETAKARLGANNLRSWWSGFAGNAADDYALRGNSSRYAGAMQSLEQQLGVSIGDVNTPAFWGGMLGEGNTLSRPMQELFAQGAIDDLFGGWKVGTDSGIASGHRMEFLMRSQIERVQGAEYAAGISSADLESEYRSDPRYNTMRLNADDPKSEFEILQDYSRRDDGTWSVGKFQTPSLYTDRLIAPRPERERGSHLISFEHLNWMGYGSQDMQEALLQQMSGLDMRTGGAFHNEAQAIFGAFNANKNTAQRQAMEDAGLIVDFSAADWEAARNSIDVGGISKGEAQAAHLEAYGNIVQDRLREQGIHNQGYGIRLGSGAIAPSPSALADTSVVTEDGYFVQDAASAWHGAFDSQAFADLSINATGETRNANDKVAAAMSKVAMEETEEYLGNQSVQRKITGANIPTVGGILHSIPGLAPNEVVVSGRHMASVMNSTYEEVVEMAERGDLTLAAFGYPSDAQKYTGTPVRGRIFEEEMKNRESAVFQSGMANPGSGAYWSEELEASLHRDNDSDYGFLAPNWVKDKEGRWLGKSVVPTSSEEILRRGQNLPESELVKGVENFQIRSSVEGFEANVAGQFSGDLWKSMAGFNKKYQEALGIKADIGPTYNALARTLFNSAMEISKETPGITPETLDRRAEAFSLLSSEGYQGLLDLKSSNDPHMRNIINATKNLNWSTRSGGPIAPHGDIQYEGEEGEYQHLKNISGWDALAGFLSSEMALVGRDSIPEDRFRAAFGPSIAERLLPSDRANELGEGREAAQEKFVGDMMSYRAGDMDQQDFINSVAEFTGAWHPDVKGLPMLGQLLTGDAEGGLGSMSPELSSYAGSMMERHFNKTGPERPGYAGMDKAHEIWKRNQNVQENVAKKFKGNKPERLAAGMGAIAAMPGRLASTLTGMVGGAPDTPATAVAAPAPTEDLSFSMTDAEWEVNKHLGSEAAGGRSQWEGLTPPGGDGGNRPPFTEGFVGGGEEPEEPAGGSASAGNSSRASGGGGGMKMYDPKIVSEWEQAEMRRDYDYMAQYMNASPSERMGMNVKRVISAAKSIPSALDRGRWRQQLGRGWTPDDEAFKQFDHEYGARASSLINSMTSDTELMDSMLMQAEAGGVNKFNMSIAQEMKLGRTVRTSAAQMGFNESGQFETTSGDKITAFVGKFNDSLKELASTLENSTKWTKEQSQQLDTFTKRWGELEKTARTLSESSGMEIGEMAGLRSQGLSDEQIAARLKTTVGSDAMKAWKQLFQDQYLDEEGNLVARGALDMYGGADRSTARGLEDALVKRDSGQAEVVSSNAERAFRGVVGGYYAMSAARHMFGEITGDAQRDMMAAGGFQDTLARFGGERGSIYRIGLNQERNQIISGLVSEEMYGGIFGMNRGVMTERAMEGAKLSVGLAGGGMMIGSALEGAGYGAAGRFVGQAGAGLGILAAGATAGNWLHNNIIGLTRPDDFNNYSIGNTFEQAGQMIGRGAVGAGVGVMDWGLTQIFGGNTGLTSRIMNSGFGQWLGADLEQEQAQAYADKIGATVGQLDRLNRLGISTGDWQQASSNLLNTYGTTVPVSDSYTMDRYAQMAGFSPSSTRNAVDSRTHLMMLEDAASRDNIELSALTSGAMQYGSSIYSDPGQQMLAQLQYAQATPEQRLNLGLYADRSRQSRGMLSAYIGEGAAEESLQGYMGYRFSLPTNAAMTPQQQREMQLLSGVATASAPYGGSVPSLTDLSQLTMGMPDNQLQAMAGLRAFGGRRGFDNTTGWARAISGMTDTQIGRYSSFLEGMEQMGFAADYDTDEAAGNMSRVLSGTQMGSVQGLLGAQSGLGLTSRDDYFRMIRIAGAGYQAQAGSQYTDAAARYLQTFAGMGMDTDIAGAMSEQFTYQAYNPAAQSRVLGMTNQLYGMGVGAGQSAMIGLSGAGMSNLQFQRTQRLAAGDPFMAAMAVQGQGGLGNALGIDWANLGLTPLVDTSTGLGAWQEQQWGLQSAGAALSYQSQMFGIGQQRQQLAISNAFNFGGNFTNPITGQQQFVANGGQYGIANQQFELGVQQQRFQFDMGWRQHWLSDEKQQWEFGLQERDLARTRERRQKDFSLEREKMETGYQWQIQDWTYSENTNQLQFGWQMEDMDRNIKYARGRERMDLERQKSRAVISEGMRREHSDDQRERIDKQHEWAEEALKRQQEYFDEDTKLQEDRLAKTKEFYERSKRLQEERMKFDQEHYETVLPLQKQLKEMSEQQARIGAEMQRKQIDHSAAMAAQQYALQQQQMAIAQEQARAQGAWEVFFKVTMPEMLNSQKVNFKQLFDTFGAESMRIIQMIAAEGNNKTAQAAVAVQNLFSGLLGNKYDGGFVAPIASYADGGMVDSMMRSFAGGGPTGQGHKYQVAGVVHGGEWVVPQEGSLVIRGDNPETLKVLQRMLTAIETLVAYGPARVKQTTNNFNSQGYDLGSAYAH